MYCLRISETLQISEVKDEVNLCLQFMRLFYFLGMCCASAVLVVQPVTTEIAECRGVLNLY